MKKLIPILLLVAILAAPMTALAAKPKFTVLAVSPGQTVTLSAEGLPNLQSFDVYMGRAGSKAIYSTYVSTVATNRLGRFIATFTIPLQYSKDYQIDVILTYTKGGKKHKYLTHFVNQSQAARMSITKVNATRNVTLEISGLQGDSRYYVWMRSSLVSTPYKALMFEVPKNKTNAKVQVPIPWKLKGEPWIYVYIVNKAGYVFTSGWFYNR